MEGFQINVIYDHKYTTVYTGYKNTVKLEMKCNTMSIKLIKNK